MAVCPYTINVSMSRLVMIHLKTVLGVRVAKKAPSKGVTAKCKFAST